MLDFFENPELLFGAPFLALGLVGLLVAASALLAPDPAAAARAPVRRAGHPDEMEYVQIGVVLAIITAIEVVVYYFDINRELFITILIALSAIKFTLVVMFFMHLKFDSKLFTTAFITGMALTAALFTVVLATLGSNLT